MRTSRTWYYQSLGEAIGPFDYDDLREKADAGEIKPTTLVRSEHGDWFSARSAGLIPSDEPVEKILVLNDKRRILYQVEDATVRFSPVIGMALGALTAGVILKGIVPALVAWIIGGAVGGVVARVFFWLLFIVVINPDRRRGKNRQ